MLGKHKVIFEAPHGENLNLQVRNTKVFFSIVDNRYTFRGGNSQNNFCLPSEKKSSLKGKNLLPSSRPFP